MSSLNLKLSDIAEALGLSKTTVSKVLNGYSDVNALTRKKVLDYVNKVDYKPNSQASFLRTKESKTVALILPQFNHEFFNSIFEGVLKNVQKSDYTLFVGCSNESSETEKELIAHYLRLNVEAIFISISQETTSFEALKSIQENEKILVLFDKIEKTILCPKVVIEDRKAAFSATEHLIKQGCRQILHFRGAYLPQISVDRYLGYRDALEAYQIPFDKSQVFLCEYGNEKEGYYAAKKVIESGIKFDGLFAITDLTALGAIQYFKLNKIKIPEDVAVVGFGNWKLSSFTFPSITTINQPGVQMGEKIFEVFLKEKKAKKEGLNPENETIKIPSQLIVRESS